ncbi:MAG: RNA methyltransferase [Chloroflexi bacterium]|nr:RNA methyltransferase [Chloroflexota bacterium]
MITSTSNERVRYVRSLYRTEVRREERAFAIEGVRLVEEALDAGMVPKLVLADTDLLEKSARGRQLLGRLRQHQWLAVSEKVLRYVSDTITPQGIVAVLPVPEVERPEDLGPLVLVLDGLRDPGNVGTIIRSAEASGVIVAAFTPDCVDVHNPKVLRAGMGAHFRLKILADMGWPEIDALLGGRPVWVAAAAQGLPHFEVDWTVDSSLIVGGEAFGASDESRRRATGFVHIPMLGRAESLNAAVAASVILFEALRQRLADKLN